MKLSCVWALLLVAAFSCSTPESKEAALVVKIDPAQAKADAQRIRKETPIKLAPGLQISLWASDSLAPDPIALEVDRFGVVYLTRTNRQKNSEFDIRGHADWMIQSISLQTSEERRGFLRRTFAPENSERNEWLKDLNGDGSHDWRDLTVEMEEVWKIEDTNGDGYADMSTRIVNDFHEEISDVAGALLVRDKDMFIGIGPDFWRLWDEDGDGVMDRKESISSGYAVHIGFGGHGMSGAIQGPDGRIYWGIGDIGANISSRDGGVFRYPNQGVIVRSDPDGSDFEVFAAGLRNTHEFVFDKYGNIISSDNDGDHPGESERLVYLVQGSDAGWRSNWQYGKYNDPRNNAYKVWMDEGMSVPRWEGQPAHIIPPLTNYHNGPAGMVYNPGTALGRSWQDKFFLVEFVGSPAGSRLWSFSLKPSGAGFRLASEKQVVSGILPTGIRFGPDGALYMADWITGWDTKNFGRVWKLDVTRDSNNLKKQRETTQMWMEADLTSESLGSLGSLLEYPDMRIRQRVQFELVDRGTDGMGVFAEALNSKNQLARIHAIWGLGQLERRGIACASLISPLLADKDHEIVAQAAKILGDVREGLVEGELMALLGHSSPRVRFFAAEALGRIGTTAAVSPLIGLIHENNDNDVYLRHAAVLALSRIGAEDAMASLVTDPDRSARIAAVLVLRRMGSTKVSLFLGDQDEYVVTEAARAINDDFSIEDALPDLAAILADERFTSEPLIRRAINAALRVGNSSSMDLLIRYAGRETAPVEMRCEALQALSGWPSPSVLDRVDGRFRGIVNRDPVEVQLKTTPLARKLLLDKNDSIAAAAARIAGVLKQGELKSELERVFRTSKSPEVRLEALRSIVNMSEKLPKDLVTISLKDESADVRSLGISHLSGTGFTGDQLMELRSSLFAKGSLQEKQRFITALGEMKDGPSRVILGELVEEMSGGSLDLSVWLDLGQAIERTGDDKLLEKFQAARQGTSVPSVWADVLYGGSFSRGRDIFYTDNAAQCMRCHRTGAEGADVGPVLSNIGNLLTREQILEALVDPGARISPGYGSVQLTLTDNSAITGILLEESNERLLLRTNEAEPLEIPLGRIAERRNLPSAMPPVGTVLERADIRDLIEFLSGLKND